MELLCDDSQKLTKSQYEEGKKALLAEIARLVAELDKLDAAEMGTIDVNHWNDLHDQRYDKEQELKRLESSWGTRNWTAADWSSWDLVASNRD